ncbi:trimethylamine methyltransferase family protein [Deltaproteobacteria bacterium OttesenSCG-928-M10]|nr:trimethylamine methyltransferase family protein [Deltaproteobacteria bacterium OttesenSCG-928-M10]
MTYLKERTGVRRMGGTGLRLFSPDDTDTIHFRSLKILAQTGVVVESREAADIYQGAGAWVEPQGEFFRVRLPQRLIHDAVAAAPKSITYYGRRPEDDFEVEPNRVGFTTFGECVNIIDPRTKEFRPTTKKDCGDIARLIDALPEMAVTLRTVCSGDQFPEAQAVHNLEALFNNSSKNILLGVGGRRNLEVMVKMAHEICGGEAAYRRRPILTAAICPTSPLTMVRDCCEALITAARTGTNLIITSMCLAGGSAPATVSAAILQHNAEFLAALTLVQLAAPGAAVTYGSCSTIMDLKTGNSVVGAPEYGMINSGIAHMARYYQLPVLCGGGLSDAKIPDAQVGYEFAVNALQSALAGANLVYGSGCLDLGLTFDYAKLMMDHECMGYIRKILGGVPTDDDSLCAGLIDEVGPGGNFLSHRDTLKRARNQSQVHLFDRHGRDRWERENPGGRTVTERAYEAALGLLETHQPYPLPEGAAAAISEMVQDYEARLKSDKKGRSDS